MRIVRVALAVAVLSLAAAGSAAAQTYHVTGHWKVGGQGGWDYVLSDDSAHRLYITHNNRVEVVDTVTGKPIGAVTGLQSTHGVALNPDGKTGYISDGKGNAIVVFDRATLAVTKTVEAGTNPDAILYEPATRTVWAFNGRSSNATVLDTAKNEVVATVALPGRPEFGTADGSGSVFVNLEDKNAIVKLDAKSHTVVATWPLAGCESPSGMAIDRTRHRLFSVCDGGVMAILDFTTGKMLGHAAIGDSPDAAGFDAKHGLAFSSNGASGTLSVVDTGKPGFPTVQTVPTARGARTMTLDAATGTVYVVTAQYEPLPANAPPHTRPRIVPDSFEIVAVSR